MKNILFLSALLMVSSCTEPMSDSFQSRVNAANVAARATKTSDQGVELSLKKTHLPKYYLNRGDTLYDLTHAHLYLTQSFVYNIANAPAVDNRNYREYCISDGIYTNAFGAHGELVNDYTGATYALSIAIFSSDKDEKLTVGDYLQDFWYNIVHQPKRWGWMYLERGDIPGGGSWEVIEASGTDTLHSIVLEKSKQPNEVMKLSYNGILDRYGDWGVWLTGNSLPSQFLFEGVVEDRRNLGSTPSTPICSRRNHNHKRDHNRNW